MNKFSQFALAAIAGLAVALCGVIHSEACTGIRVQSKDGAVVHARTMEFAANLDSNVLIVPRHMAIKGTAPSGRPGLAWETKYAAVGMNAQGQSIIMDGLNEKGLAGGVFYFPGYTQYQDVPEADESLALGAWELLTWILTSFATVDEVRSGLANIKVGDALPPGWSSAPPAHYIVHDAAGNSLVIEYVLGKLNLYENKIGVITNSPDFQWHITNLRNYVNLSPTNIATVDFDGLKIAQLGQGSGLLGIPGDFTPPSRFVCAAILSRGALPTENAEEAVEQAFHILDSFDITRGDIRGVEGGQPSFELTQWTSASDTQNCVFYFHSYDNRRVRRVDLLKADLNAKEYVTIPERDTQDFDDLTPAASKIDADSTLTSEKLSKSVQ